MWFSWNREPETALSTPRFYSFVGAEGPSAVPLAERPTSCRSPPKRQPGEAEETGPSLIVYDLGLGEGAHIASASLTTAAGQAVAIRVVDGRTRYEGPEAMPVGGGCHPREPARRRDQLHRTHRLGSRGRRQATQTFKITTQARSVFYDCKGKVERDAEHGRASPLTHRARDRQARNSCPPRTSEQGAHGGEDHHPDPEQGGRTTSRPALPQATTALRLESPRAHDIQKFGITPVRRVSCS
jgi:hypothetical protein